MTDIQALAAVILPMVEQHERKLANEIRHVDSTKFGPPIVMAANRKEFEETHARWAEYHEAAERVRALAAGGKSVA